MSIPSIPQDALVEILIRLPVKSLLRFRCVSKAWYSLVSGPAFISAHTHFTNSLTKKSNLLMLEHYFRDTRTAKFSLRFDDGQSFDEYRDLGAPVDGSCVRINGSCHGLICLSFVEKTVVEEEAVKLEKIVIWNPTLGIIKAVTESTFNTSDDPAPPDHVGFGYDGKRNEYKIVKFPFVVGGSGTPLVPPRQFEVFELSKNAWRTVTPRVTPPFIFDLAPPVFFNGSLHWVGGDTIVALDLAEEEFREMKLPGALVASTFCAELHIKVKEMRYLSVTQFNLYSGNRFFIGRYPGNRYSCDIWVMKEYGVEGSWFKLCTIHQPATVQPVGFRTNGELLVVEGGHGVQGRLASYNCDTNEVTYLGHHGDNEITFVGEYVETLAVLKAGGF